MCVGGGEREVVRDCWGCGLFVVLSDMLTRSDVFVDASTSDRQSLRLIYTWRDTWE